MTEDPFVLRPLRIEGDPEWFKPGDEFEVVFEPELINELVEKINQDAKERYNPERAEEILRQAFREGKTFEEAIALIEDEFDTVVDGKTKRILEAQWSVWELYGDEKK